MSDAIDKLQDLWFAWDQGSMIGMADTINAIRPALDEMAEARAEIARLTAELAAARAEVDCGQDGPCAKAPGCARHWQERNRELVAELAAARAVTAGVCRYLDCAASDLLAVVTSLYETRARAISDATAARDAEWEKRIPPACLRRIAHDLDDCPDYCETCAVQSSARGTVGGQTGPVGKLLGSHAIVEWYAAPDWYQARIAQHRTGTVKGADLRWRHENARNWSSWGQPWGDPAQHMDQPARLVPAAEADADPNQRGPLPKGG